ncbi:hypothetical protein [Pelagicoccus sp. SDUM812003]|uniref:hypothetical protein n=1 Tax=Pelagicoccus sp. SDUM812003 TaxID=3041267 RepID=UPI0028100CB6|nr:hypothetical protein [Pelagicoccus sp. SDUM812003]MDQ8203089.1 hypothetical protein [Pelagicoccus sp. SDUM812003]
MKQAINRFLINWYQASDKPLPKWLRAACSKDNALEEELRRGDELTRCLRKRSETSNTAWECEGMANRVMTQITREDYAAELARKEEDAPASSAWVPWVRSIGSGAIACAIAIYAVQNWMSHRQDVETATQIVQALPDDASVETVEDLGDNLLEMGAGWKNPLDQEIEYVLSDAKGALGFLADSFVPSSLRKRIEQDSNA